jgi:hypothetical protein
MIPTTGAAHRSCGYGALPRDNLCGNEGGFSRKDKEPAAFDPAGEAVLYLQALANMRVFFEKKIDPSSMEEILKSAIEAEKDSIIFYLGMRDLVPEKSGKDKIDAIIGEEKKHIQLLSKELVSLKKK